MSRPKFHIDIVVGMQDCGHGYDAADLEAIAVVFTKAAGYARAAEKDPDSAEYGEVIVDTKDCNMLGSVTLWPDDRDLPDDGVPVIHRVFVKGRAFVPKDAMR